MDNKLIMYNILNGIKPFFKRTKYPYTHWTPDKIIFTQKKIKLVFSKDERFYKNPGTKKKRGGGQLYLNDIIFII